MQKKLVIMCLCGFFVLTSSWCFADTTTIFSDLADGQPYLYSTDSYGISSGDLFGFEFTASSTASLSSIEIALGLFGGDPTVTLYSGSPSGTVLESWTAVPSLSVLDGSDLVTLPVSSSSNPTNPPTLQEGSSYWLVVSNDSSDAIAWGETLLTDAEGNPLSGLVYDSEENPNTDPGTMGAFEVTGVSVPEPVTALFLGPTLVGLAVIRRRFKK